MPPTTPSTLAATTTASSGTTVSGPPVYGTVNCEPHHKGVADSLRALTTKEVPEALIDSLMKQSNHDFPDQNTNLNSGSSAALCRLEAFETGAEAAAAPTPFDIAAWRPRRI